MSDVRPDRVGAQDSQDPIHMQDNVLAMRLTALQPDLVAWARSLVYHEEAEDVVQEALLSIWRRREGIGRGRVTNDLRGYLFARVRDVALDTNRKSRRRRNNDARLTAGRSAERTTHVSSPFISGVRHWMRPEHELDEQESVKRLHEAIETLEPLQRELLTLVYAHGMSPGEAASVLSLRPINARVVLLRTHARLRALLESDELMRSARQGTGEEARTTKRRKQVTTRARGGER